MMVTEAEKIPVLLPVQKLNKKNYFYLKIPGIFGK